MKSGFDPDFADPVKRPIGVFDSGIGGLSILKALRAELPHEDFVYVADSGHAPYGERDDAHVINRSSAITAHLLAQYNIQALVMACNTATAKAIATLRQAHPLLPIIGVEPALKPALAMSKTRRIGVMATRGTLGSAKFGTLVASLAGQPALVCEPCDGLADAIERQDDSKIIALCAYYTRAMGQFGINIGEIDTLVLGCTHYPFASDALRQWVGPGVQLIDPGEAVARQTRRQLPEQSCDDNLGTCQLLSTGATSVLHDAAQRWLGLDQPVNLLLL
ncbi:MAG: glutamate racemase [Gammaproteobacteria bacterium]|uniref:glutamate racemase n=1 Tax=Rhodoferax sp. TaxID=50421 RepID=UPI0017AAA92C|nr:glutamate racemase [Rhodoferax sp.]MBU3897634.1 glutamate racemase [Gammaproteobacteria bacterium]MBA3058260.1 glutamate racemase [Rhodoferax sp.]MBU3999461.1 glutamate racemase [Gammaproteobacteria bacterium]MBU4017722.1 glutamate racemase [Gammaproteobacteria bacterium]MBU4081165.1 glutamate racemase [Gammaproteobacteria bacterium]